MGDYQVNTILLWCDETLDAVWFDPSAESELIVREIIRRSLKLTALINTHGHVDHISENAVVKSKFSVPLLIHPLDRPMLIDPMLNLSAWTGQHIISPDADATITDTDLLTVGQSTLKVLHIPGHSPGSLAFYSDQGFVIAGDTLFQGGVGRTDFPGCSESQLLTGIRTKLYTLPDTTIVYPGHGPETSIGEEKVSNPFVRG